MGILPQGVFVNKQVLFSFDVELVALVFRSSFRSSFSGACMLHLRVLGKRLDKHIARYLILRICFSTPFMPRSLATVHVYDLD